MKKLIFGIIAAILVVFFAIRIIEFIKIKDKIEFYSGGALFTYTDLSPCDYTFGDIYTPSSESWDEDYESDSYHAELYVNSDDMIELSAYESKMLLKYMQEATYTAIKRDEAYALGLLKTTDDGRYENLTAIELDIMFYYYSAYPKSVIGDYYSVTIDIARSGGEVYLVVMETGTIRDNPSTKHRCIFKCNQSKDLYNYIETLRFQYAG